MNKKQFFLLSALLAAACGVAAVWDAQTWRANQARILEEAPMENEYIINGHGALHFEDVGMGYVDIGYGSTDWAEYVDDQGMSRKGYVARLDMITAESLSSAGPSSREVVDVHVGQVIGFGGYRIEVIDIWNCGSSFQVRYCIKLLIMPDQSEA